MKRYYLFKYEGVSQAKITEVEKALLSTQPDASIQYADSSMMVLITRVPKSTQVAIFVQDEIWKHNGGLLCSFTQVDEQDNRIKDLI